MPTCWNGDLGTDNDHMSHMAYTLDGSVAGPCPAGYDRRLPEIQLFVRINNYKGASFQYTLADELDIFHVDFMNGWKEGKLQEVIDNCPVVGDSTSYNPPCNCDGFLTPNLNIGGTVCDSDVRDLIIDEATDVVTELPRGTCQGVEVIPKSWDIDPPLQCAPLTPIPTQPEDSEDDNDSEESEDPEDPEESEDDNDSEESEDPEDPEESEDPEEPEEPQCVDSPLSMVVQNREIDCGWVNEKPINRCKKRGVASHCPATCNKCESFRCEDSQRRFKLGDKNRKCKFFQRKPARCDDHQGAKETCRSACDYCGNNARKFWW